MLVMLGCFFGELPAHRKRLGKWLLRMVIPILGPFFIRPCFWQKISPGWADFSQM
jgi:hypothetical protein